MYGLVRDTSRLGQASGSKMDVVQFAWLHLASFCLYGYVAVSIGMELQKTCMAPLSAQTMHSDDTGDVVSAYQHDTLTLSLHVGC